MKNSKERRVSYEQINYSRVNDEEGNTIITAKIKGNDSSLKEPYFEFIKCIVDKEGNGRFVGEPRYIPEGYFYSFKRLLTIFIPNSVEMIMARAFKECSKLYQVDFENSSNLKRINDYAFEGTKSLNKIKLPNQVSKIGLKAFGNSRIKTIDLSDSSICILNRSTFTNCRRLEEVILPRCINRICHNCFEGCKKLQNVYSYKGIEDIIIETDAFKDCALFEGIKSYNDVLKQYTIPDEHDSISVEQVGKIIVNAKSKEVKLISKSGEGYQAYIIPSEIYKAKEIIRRALFEVQKKSKKEIEDK